MSEGPDFRVTVTGPSASAQVISKGVPASISLKSLLVRATVAQATPARTREEMMNFILVDYVESSIVKSESRRAMDIK